MLPNAVVLGWALAYGGLLVAVARYAERRTAQGRSVVSHPVVYALSLGVYCTAWTFYGSVGRAVTSGVGFLPIYLGPTLLMLLAWPVVRKVVRISNVHRLTSIADFIASRYGKSARLAGGVTVLAVVGVVPYLALQLKALAASYAVLVDGSAAAASGPRPAIWADPALWAAGVLAGLAILFGARRLDVTERHEGLVAAVAVESVVKLLAFLAVGAYVTFGLFDGMGALFAEAARHPETRRLFTLDGAGVTGAGWVSLMTLGFLAMLLLPRQFQVAIVENVDEDHLRRASWLFPLYLLLMNLFVLPLAVAGLLVLGPEAEADLFVLTVPLAEGQRALALVAFLGGLSAASSMVIVGATALSTMVSNDLVMPVLLRVRALRLGARADLTGLLLGIRRAAIVGILLLGYAFHHLVGEGYALVSIGLVSFAAVAQLAPVTLGALYWTRGTRHGAAAGLVAGFVVWGYTLPLPTLAEAGLLAPSFVAAGPGGIGWLRPHALFGVATLDPVPHALFWSLLANAAGFVGGSLATRPGLLERSQAAAFVDVHTYAERLVAGRAGASLGWRGTAPAADLRRLLRRFLGPERAEAAWRRYAHARALDPDALAVADEDLVHHTERLLAGAVGAASARAVVASVAEAKPLRAREVMDLLDEARQALAHSRALERQKAELERKTTELERKTTELEHKTTALERATEELQAANDQLKELDRLKDDFVATVSHELRTPLTAIRAHAEILHAHPDLAPAQRAAFLATVVRESERLTRLVSRILDVQKLDAGHAARPPACDAVVDLARVARHAADALRPAFDARGTTLALDLPPAPVPVRGDADRLTQVVLNLLDNAATHCAPDPEGRVTLRVRAAPEAARLAVTDDGPGIAPDEHAAIFERFRQARRPGGPVGGSGLGLAIAERIVRLHDGQIGVESTPGDGATFWVTLPPATPGGDGRASPAAGAPAAGAPSTSQASKPPPSQP